MQYDYGKLIQGQGFKINGVLNQPPEIVLAGLGKVRSAPIKSGKFTEYFSKYKPGDYADIMRDTRLRDRLFQKHDIHIEASGDSDDNWSFDFGNSGNRRGGGENVMDQRDDARAATEPNDPCKM